jgi:hypothetical protein
LIVGGLLESARDQTGPDFVSFVSFVLIQRRDTESKTAR